MYKVFNSAHGKTKIKLMNLLRLELLTVSSTKSTSNVELTDKIPHQYEFNFLNDFK